MSGGAGGRLARCGLVWAGAISAGCAAASVPPGAVAVRADHVAAPPIVEAEPSAATPAPTSDDEDEDEDEDAVLRIQLQGTKVRELDFPERMVTYVVDVATDPPQHLVVGEVVSKPCHLQEAEEQLGGPSEVLSCSGGGRYFGVSFERRLDGLVEVTANLAVEMGEPSKNWVVGTLRIPPGEPVRFQLLDADGEVAHEVHHQAGL